MGEAIIGALLRAGVSTPEELLVSDNNQERLKYIEKNYSTGIAENNFALFQQSDIIILAVKPQVMEPVISEITAAERYSSCSGRRLIISIAAGIPLSKLEALFYSPSGNEETKTMPIIRVMPNTPALVLSGMSGMSGNQYATVEDMRTAETILAAMGTVVTVEEKEMDAVTAVSGSGPAYVFFLAESMIEAGLSLGLEPDKAVTLTMKTIEGAFKLMQDSADPPETLRKKVTSPGGTTEAAFQILSKNRVKETFVTAIARAAERSRELSR